MIQRSLRSLLAPAENPRSAPDDPLQRQRLLREQVRSAMKDLEAAINRIETGRVAAEADVASLETSAREAIAARQEDVARIALRRQHLALSGVRHLNRQLAPMSAELHRLGLLEQQIGTHVDEYANRSRLAEMRRTAAQVQVEIGEALTEIEPLPEPHTIAGLERDAESLEARAAAIEELLAAGILGRNPWPATADQGIEQEIDRQIASLRDEMRSGQGVHSSSE
jgi:phage shock protein A